jgi:prenyltransferase/squalene oxidase-like repeat protein
MKYNPLCFLRKDSSIFGTAARYRWDSASETEIDLPAQETNGSINNSVVETVSHLYNISLFRYKSDVKIDAALNWLLEYEHKPLAYNCNDGASYSNMFFKTSRIDNEKIRKLKGLPFTMGCSGFFKTGAVLYLTSHFGKLEDERVRKAYKNIVSIPQYRKGWYCSPSCGNNLFQAVVKHPIYSAGRAVDQNLAYLRSKQLDNGSWSGGLPFYPIVNALSYLKQVDADRILSKAIEKLINSQNKDGSWGRTDKALKTYLILDAMERKDIRIAI